MSATADERCCGVQSLTVILRLQMDEVNVGRRKRARNNSSAMPKCLLVRRADKHAAHAPGRFAGTDRDGADRPSVGSLHLNPHHGRCTALAHA
jgi:hypothetical protein